MAYKIPFRVPHWGGPALVLEFYLSRKGLINLVWFTTGSCSARRFVTGTNENVKCLQDPAKIFLLQKKLF